MPKTTCSARPICAAYRRPAGARMLRRISTATLQTSRSHHSIARWQIDRGDYVEKSRSIALRSQRSRLRLRLETTGFRARTRLTGRRHRRAARRRRPDDGFARRPLAGEQILDLVAGQRLEFEQRLGQRLEIAALFLENLLRLFVTCLD